MIDDEDEPADSCGPAVAEALRRSSPHTAEMVRQHIEDNDEVLSTILLGEVGRWYASSVADGRREEDARRVAKALADLFTTGDDEMETVIATGFIEALPQRGDAARSAVDQLPEPLLEELHRMENWTPPAR